MQRYFKGTERSAKDIAVWFLQRNEEEQFLNDDVEGISNLKLQKLLYYAYGCFLALNEERLFSELIEAWKHGPVVPNIYELYKGNGSHSIEFIPIENLNLSKDITDVLEWVYSEFGKFTAWALRNMTHDESPWRETKPNAHISDELIFDYFSEHYVEET